MVCTGVTVNATDGNPLPCEGYRLPTEAEWEYAARAGSTTAFYNGPITETGSAPVDPNLDAIGWYIGNASNTTHAVGGKPANAWGLHDMAGNVYEWAWDWYGSDYYTGRPAPDIDPLGAASGSVRVGRGGSWGSHAWSCRAANRDRYSPGDCIYVVGFRPARSVRP